MIVEGKGVEDRLHGKYAEHQNAEKAVLTLLKRFCYTECK
jgi:hypothetical protein